MCVLINSVQPSNITIIASCSQNGNTYAVGPTTSPFNVLPANATQVVWNPWQAEQVPGAIPFAQATYVLKMWDERGPGSAVKGGYMSPYSGTQFAMYRPAPYTSNAGKLTVPWAGCQADGQMVGSVLRAVAPWQLSANQAR
jgi:hypothetical protein